MSRRGRGARLGPALLFAMAPALLLGQIAPGGAAAAYDPVSSGSTTLVLAKPFRDLLARNHAQIVAKGGAAKRGAKLVLPASGGRVDPALGSGTVEAAGTLVFMAAGRRLPFRDIAFKAKRAPLYAKVGGGRLKIATAARLEARRVGFGASFAATSLRLTAKAASRLNKKLGLGDQLAPGQLIGSMKAIARPATVHLREEGRVQLAIDPPFAEKLDDLFVSLNPIAPAELAPGPLLSFPIGLESTLAPNGSSGTIKLGGQVELLQLGNAQIFWREVWVQPGAGALLAESETLPAPPFPGKQAQAPLLSLQPWDAVRSDPSARTISVSGGGAVLTAATAAALNEAFAGSQNVFAAGEAIGSVSFTAWGE